MKTLSAILMVSAAVVLAACKPEDRTSAQKRDAEAVDRQQSQYAIAQPVPAYDYSLERDLLIQLYNVRNQKVSTHSVWRSDFGQIEGDCTSMGYGLPYDTSLTNPLVGQEVRTLGQGANPAVSISQPEPNGIFASQNTAATWVFCLSPAGIIEPVYVETKVTVYPGPVEVDYDRNRVVRSGDPSVTIETR